MDEEKLIVKCNNCGQILISGYGPIKCSFGHIECRKCGSKEVSVQGKLQNEKQNVKFEI